MTIESEKCPICLMPKAATDTGSVTQWISLCRCGTSLPQIQDKSLRICRDCGKPLAEDIDGSFTQWVVSASTCVCRYPNLAVGQSRPTTPEPLPVDLDEEEETELELSQEHLPLDRYKPIRVLGMGGAGKVYLCRDRLLNTRVAVKILRIQSNEQLVSFQQEAKAISKLTHPSIIQILNFGVTDDGRPYMVLEYINGVSLSQTLIANGPLDEDAAIDLFTMLSDALGYANSMGVFHRDVKPSNILLTKSIPAEARIIDFGIAKTVSTSAQAKSQGNALVGTPAYMSPDQINNLPYDSRSEVYSFGCVMFEGLTGRPPFQSDLALDLLSKHVNEEPPLINEVAGREAVSDEMQAILSKCLMKSPDDRFQSLQEVLQQLLILKSNQAKTNQIADSVEVEESAKASPATPISKTKLVLASIVTATIICGATATIIQNSMREEKPYKPVTPHPEPVAMSTIVPPEIKNAIKSGVVAFDLFLYPKINDDAFKAFKGENTVQEINAYDQPITDKALTYLRDLKGLRTLNLKDTEVSDLTPLANVTNLASLNLINTKVTDDSLIALKNLKKLKYLEMKTTKITAKGLEHLIGLPSLIEANVDFPSKYIPFEDMCNLIAKYPDCKFLTTPANAQSIWQDAAKSFLNKDYRTALSKYEYALKAYDKQRPPQYMIAIECTTKIADCYTHLGKPTHAAMYRDSALKIAIKSKSFENMRIAYKFWIGNELAQHNYQFADEKSREYLKWLKTIPNTQRFIVDACNQMLSAYSGAGDGHEKQRRFWLVEKLAVSNDAIEIALTTGALAGCQKKLGEKAASLKNFEKASDMFERLGATRFDWRSVVGLYADYGGSEADRGNLTKALELNAYSIKYTKNQDVPKDIKTLLLRTRIDYLLRLKRPDEAAKVKAKLDKIL